MSVREYIGARYVPIFADPLEWDATRTYEPLTIVTYQGDSYTSRQAVPAGIPITNNAYWALTGNYNAQIEQYRAEVQAFDGSITANATAISNEVLARQNADTTLAQYISDEEIARQNADTAINNRLDNIKAIFGTVSEMISYTELAEGNLYAVSGYHTDGDGGAAIYKIIEQPETLSIGDVEVSDALIARLMPGKSVGFQQFGAYGNGTNDDTEYIRDCMEYANDKNLKIACSGTFMVTDTITFPYHNMTVDINGTIETASSITVLRITGSRNNIYINKLLQSGTNYTGIGIELFKGERDYSGITLCFNNIKFNECLNFSVGINFRTLAGYGIQYNIVDFEYILANECIVYDCANAANSWITQNGFYNGRVSGNYGFVCRNNPNQPISDNNVFSNIGFEGLSQSAMILYKVVKSTFENIRLLENSSMQGNHIELHNSYENVFNGAIDLVLDKLLLSDISNRLICWNEFDCSLILAASGGWRGKKLITVGTSKIMTEIITRPLAVTMSERSAVIANEFEYVFSGISINVGSSTGQTIVYTLPAGIFLFPDFWLNVNVLYNNGSMTFVDDAGNTLLDASSLTPGRYVFKLGTRTTLLPVKVS